MDLTKILKKGDKVYCTIYGYVNVTRVNTTSISVSNEYSGIVVNCTGKYNNNGECLLFPSKENRDWSTWKIKEKCPFKPFDKVLVRLHDVNEWQCGYFSHLSDSYNRYCASSAYWHQCIPYNKETQHLVGTNQDCPDKYKIW